MKLSIVVICLDEAQHLPRCLGAIRDIDHAGLDVEVIVVDGGSTDNSRAIAECHGARVIQSPRGIPIQRNLGARTASGELLGYVDADVELLDGWFGAVARHFRDAPRSILGGPPHLAADASWIAKAYALHWGDPGGDSGIDPGSRRTPAGKPRPRGATPANADELRVMSTESLVMGRAVFDEVGGFPEHLGVDEDTHFILSAEKRGISIQFDPELAYAHHGVPRTLAEFFRRVAWGANYREWFSAIGHREWAQVWRPQYIYGAAIGLGVFGLGTSLLAGPLCGWPIGVPLCALALACATMLPAVRTAHRHGAYEQLAELWLMYGAYGLATAGALVGVGSKKDRRWR